MDIDKSQHESFQKQGDTAFVSQGVLGKESRLFFFKNKMVLSTKDYVIICCLAMIALIVVAATIYMQPLEFFHVISKEQLQALHAMAQEQFQGGLQEGFNAQFVQKSYLQQMKMLELWRAAGWNGVWAFLCLLPQGLLGCLIGFFPFIFFLRAILKRELKGMVQQLEQSLEQQETNDSAEHKRGRT